MRIHRGAEGARGDGAFACLPTCLPDINRATLPCAAIVARALSLARRTMARRVMGAGPCDDLKFQRSNRILHRHDALPSLEGALQIWSLQACRSAPPATDIPGNIADARGGGAGTAIVSSRESDAVDTAYVSECLAISCLSLTLGGLRGAIAPRCNSSCCYT